MMRQIPSALKLLMGVAFTLAGVIGACQSPESFHRGGGVVPGTGGDLGPGSGGDLGSGGMIAGTGGLPGSGGRGSGGAASGGAVSTGGAATGGRGGAGGAASGGRGTGGAATGGRGSGGAATGGAGDSGGGAATGGAGGGVGAAGGGAGDTVVTCPMCKLSIQCDNPQSTNTTSMNADVYISNTGTQAIPLSQITVRYYYSNETAMPMILEVHDKAFKNPTGGARRDSNATTFTGTNGKLTSPVMDYTDITFMTADILDSSLPFFFNMTLHDTGYTKLDPTNDYSNGPMTVAACPHIVAMIAGGVVAGTPPP